MYNPRFLDKLKKTAFSFIVCLGICGCGSGQTKPVIYIIKQENIWGRSKPERFCEIDGVKYFSEIDGKRIEDQNLEGRELGGYLKIGEVNYYSKLGGMSIEDLLTEKIPRKRLSGRVLELKTSTPSREPETEQKASSEWLKK